MTQKLFAEEFASQDRLTATPKLTLWILISVDTEDVVDRFGDCHRAWLFCIKSTAVKNTQRVYILKGATFAKESL